MHAAEQRALWSRMSVFAGGCDLEAATRRLHGGGRGAERRPGSSCPALVEKSVVVAGEGRRRRGPVRPARVACGVRTAAAHTDEGQLDRWRGRHLDWCADLAAGFRLQWVGDRQAAAAASGAHGSTPTSGQRWSSPSRTAASIRAETGLRIATDLDTFWVTAGLAQEARHWLETTLATGSRRGRRAGARHGSPRPLLRVAARPRPGPDLGRAGRSGGRQSPRTTEPEDCSPSSRR